jgi:hypothetical protein
MFRRFDVLTFCLSAFVAALTGCRSTPQPFPLEPIPMRSAVRIVNDNTARIAGTLRATGFVDGRSTLPDGRSVSYHLDGVLFFLAPRYVRFDLKSFGSRKFLLGSNAEYYWVFDGEANEYRCGRHGEERDLSSEIPIPPDRIVDALGLTPIRLDDRAPDHHRLVQRVVEDFQQILFLERSENKDTRLGKEYWLDRYRPRLVRRVIFRDAGGVVELESSLDEYKAISPGGPMLPYEITMRWPGESSHVRFRVGRWELVESVVPESIQYSTPRECIGR